MEQSELAFAIACVWVCTNNKAKVVKCFRDIDSRSGKNKILLSDCIKIIDSKFPNGLDSAMKLVEEYNNRRKEEPKPAIDFRW